MKVEAETAAQGDEQMMLEACETISNEGLRADMAIRAALVSAPQPSPHTTGRQPALPEITAGDRLFLHYNPNTNDIVDWIQRYANTAITADRASRVQADSVTAPAQQGKWAWVPVEPSTAMLVAGNHGQPGDFSAFKVWQDMLGALERSFDYTRPLDPPSAAAQMLTYGHGCPDAEASREMVGEPMFAFRRKGLKHFCTCTKERYAELSAKPNLFETRIFYTTPPTHTAGNVLEDAGGANWQDISTAPKDGTRFVAVGNNYGLDSETQHTCIAQWFRGCWMEVSDWNEASELKYLTHWMPLPPLPGSAASATADSVLEDADPLQGAANWLVKAHSGLGTRMLARKLSIGYNRAKRLHDAAIAARKQGGA